MNLFGGRNDAPAPAPIPAPPPSRDSAPVTDTAAEERRRRQLAAGRASTIITGGQGVQTNGASKVLLGS